MVRVESAALVNVELRVDVELEVCVAACFLAEKSDHGKLLVIETQ